MRKDKTAKKKKRAAPTPSPSSGRSKKPYRQPELLQWGTIVDLTAGPLSGAEDFPVKGGTGGV